jgi:hypothetical protein
LAIADTGVGLRQSYLNFGHGELSHAEAIRNALAGISTKAGESGLGFGLRTCLDMLVRGMKGEFFLWSGDSFFMNNPGLVNLIEMKDGTSFPGVYLALRIPTTYDRSFQYTDYIG